MFLFLIRRTHSLHATAIDPTLADLDLRTMSSGDDALPPRHPGASFLLPSLDSAVRSFACNVQGFFLPLRHNQEQLMMRLNHTGEPWALETSGFKSSLTFQLNAHNPAKGDDRRESDGFRTADQNDLAKSEAAKGWISRAASASLQAKTLMKDIPVFERARIGAAAGGIAGAFTYACLHPIDTVKTKLQTRGASDIYSGPLDVAIKTFKQHGILGFYSGISAVLVGSTVSSAIYFGTCELGKALLSNVPCVPPIVVPPLAGGMGNLVSSAVLIPKEVVTQRMQAGAAGRSWEVVLRTIEAEGIGGLYTGYSAALFRNLPASVLSFSSFEYIKAAWLKRSGKMRLDPWQSVASGALAGAISAALTTPLDVVKTRLMTQARNTPLITMGAGVEVLARKAVIEAEFKAKITAATYKGISSTLRQIWLEEGWIGLTRGVGPRLLHSACFSALGYFAFETARLEFLKRYLAKRESVCFSEHGAISGAI